MIFKDFDISVTNCNHSQYVEQIITEIAQSAKARGIGVANKSKEHLLERINSGNSVIAININSKKWAGFCYIDLWNLDKFIVHSGLIVNPIYRNYGLAKVIKKTIFDYSKKKYPDYRIFGITNSAAVMKINSDLGYTPVSFAEITQDIEFWKGCKSCVNYEILKQKKYKNCLCTALLYNNIKQKK
ncbi:MAG: GNAT family N-acetyltransferase [Bacteroides sp.]|nr:MAG: GNAT family N-acetyltransferase [Bacteroides sp.]